MSQDPDGGDRFALLTTIGDLAAARIAAAVLEAEGIEVRLHGDALGPYRFSVGDMARVEVWVRAGSHDEAASVLEASEIETTGLETPAAYAPLPPLIKAAIWFTGAVLLVGLVRWVL